jgi:hypothetical protein
LFGCAGGQKPVASHESGFRPVDYSHLVDNFKSHNHEKWRMNDWRALWPGAMRLEVMRTLGKDMDVL